MVGDLVFRSSINIHLLNLLDGSPHEVPLQKVITLDSGHYLNPLVANTQISGSRVALLIETLSSTLERYDRELVAWDWKTGEVVSDSSSQGPDFNPTSTQVLRYSSDNTAIGSAISSTTHMSFFEGSWLLSLCYEGPAPRLLFLNTLLPQQDLRSWRILGLPLLPGPRYYTQYEKAPTEYPEFSVDPSQRIFVSLLCGRALITPVDLLMRRMNSARASPYIPWEEWVEDVTVVHLHHNAHTLQLVDMKVLALCGSVHRPEGWGVQIYDLSKSGRRDIQVQPIDEGTDWGCREVLLTPKWFARCQMGDGIPHVARLVGNKVVCFFVSPLFVQTRSYRIQHCIVQYQPSYPDGPYPLRIWKVG